MLIRRHRDLHSLLCDHRRYERQIERLHQRHLFSRRLYELQQDGVSLASLAQQKSKLARMIARTVGRGEYQLEPANVRKIIVDGKAREVFALRLTDAIVHGAVARLIEEVSATTLSSRLYSYRPGVSWWKGVADCAEYFRAHRRTRPDVRTRGLYVIRRDIESYTDSIPVGACSPVWPMIRRLLQSIDPRQSMTPSDWALVEKVVRPEASFDGGGTCTLYRGVATGQPISCVLFNLYLSGLDQELAAVPEAFYARYSDDLVFAHADPAVVREASRRIDARVSALRLGLNEHKSHDLYVTGAGRRSAEWPEAVPTTAVRFLGCRIAASGTIALNRKKVRRLLHDVATRANQTARAVAGADREEIGRTVCAVINRIVKPDSDVFQQRSATLLRRAVTDRHQLKQIDHWIARLVIEAITGSRGVKALRSVPYRTVRGEWKLVSVLHARNKWIGPVKYRD